MALTSGTKLGPYVIESPLGAGGMGEVYRARDTRLNRSVAIKILPDSYARDDDRLRRFQQEAHAVAALNHPNILAIHDVGDYNGAPFLVSELLDGQTLRAVLENGAVSQRKAIDYGVQVAQGLAAAHEKGIVHRDLKPENLFLNKDGQIKILDFGLAKLAAAATAAAGDATLTSAQTAMGTVIGTAGYMAPEQVRGQPADARTDIFAFGAVLFETLSGLRAFERDTTAETMTAVLKDDPPEISDPKHAISPAMDRITRRCLEKNPDQRFQSARDLSFALSALSGSDSSSAVRVAPVAPAKRFVSWIAVGMAVLVVATATWFLAKRSRPQQDRMEFVIPGNLDSEVTQMALSADGKMLAFVSPDERSAEPVLHVQRIGSATSTVLAGTEGANYPFWSPDGSYVAFFANGKLEKMTASGSSLQVLATVAAARGGSWGSKNVILYAPDASSVLWKINADGTGAGPLTNAIATKDDQSHRWPVFLPDGEHFLFWAGSFNDAKDESTGGIYVSSLSGKERKLVTHAHSNAGYAAGSLILADNRQQLVALPFDASSATVSGEPSVITGLVGFQPSTYWAAFANADNGTLVYNTSAQAASSVLTWVDRRGKELGRMGQPGIVANPTLSPDGARVTIDVTDEKASNVDVWIEGLQGGANSRFTFDPSEEVLGIWSRDGKNIAYRAAVAGATLFVKPATGREKERAALNMDAAFGDIYPNSWSADDKQILCTMVIGGMDQASLRSRLVLVPASGGKPTTFLSTSGSVTNGQISPDSKWVAYASNESGAWEVYVTSFPDATGKWQVSRGGGAEPRWRGDGKEIFYISSTGMLMASPIDATGSFATGTPAPLFQIYGRSPVSSTDLFTYDVTRDGQRFLVNRYVKPNHVQPLNIVLHATAETRK